MDLIERFNELDEARSFNIIDHVVAVEMLDNAKTENDGTVSMQLVRATIDKEYDRMGRGTDEYSGTSGSSQLNYVQPTQDGYGGFLAEGLVG